MIAQMHRCTDKLIKFLPFNFVNNRHSELIKQNCCAICASVQIEGR